MRSAMVKFSGSTLRLLGEYIDHQRAVLPVEGLVSVA